jgi:putative membrane protein
MIYNCNDEWYYFGMHEFWWFFWIILMTLLVLMLLRLNSTNKIRKDSSLYVLRQKYASGEISTQEFEEKKRVLEKE